MILLASFKDQDGTTTEWPLFDVRKMLRSQPPLTHMCPKDRSDVSHTGRVYKIHNCLSRRKCLVPCVYGHPNGGCITSAIYLSRRSPPCCKHHPSPPSLKTLVSLGHLTKVYKPRRHATRRDEETPPCARARWPLLGKSIHADTLQSEDEGDTAGKDGADEGGGSTLVVAAVSGSLGGAGAGGGLARALLAGLGGRGVARLGGRVGAGAGLGGRGIGGSGAAAGGVAAAAAVVGGALAVLEEVVGDALLAAIGVLLSVLRAAVTLVTLGNALDGVDGLGLVGARDLSSC